MRPVNFVEMNCVYAENQPEYLPLPALKEPYEVEGVWSITSCWELSWRERIKLFFQGHVYVTQLSGGHLQPQRVHLTVRGE